MNIKILGGGCAKCHKLQDIAKKVADELNVDYTIEEVKNVSDIVAYGVMKTPALVIDEEVKIKGRVPKEDEVRKIIESCK